MLSLMLARRGLVQQKSVHLHHSKLWHSKQLSRMPDSAKSASVWHMQGSGDTSKEQKQHGMLSRGASIEYSTQQDAEQQGDLDAAANPGRLHLYKERKIQKDYTFWRQVLEKPSIVRTCTSASAGAAAAACSNKLTTH